MHLQAKRAVNFGGSRTWADVSLVDLGTISSQLRRDLGVYIKVAGSFPMLFLWSVFRPSSRVAVFAVAVAFS